MDALVQPAIVLQHVFGSPGGVILATHRRSDVVQGAVDDTPLLAREQGRNRRSVLVERGFEWLLGDTEVTSLGHFDFHNLASDWNLIRSALVPFCYLIRSALVPFCSGKLLSGLPSPCVGSQTCVIPQRSHKPSSNATLMQTGVL